MQKITLVRHGQASYGTDNYDKLSPLGHEQSALLGTYFKQIGYQFDAVLTGKMVRHHETAQQILTAMGSEQTYKQHSGFDEFDFEAVVNAYLQANPNAKPQPDSPRSEFYRLLKNAMIAWSNNQLGSLPETWMDFQQRVVDGVEDAIAQYPEAEHLLVATSGGAIAMLKGHTLGLTASKLVDMNLQIRNASFHQYLVKPRTYLETSFNQIAHLELANTPHLLTYS